MDAISHELDDAPQLAAQIPPKILEGLRNYALHHQPTGSFLRCVLENDLMGAVGRADGQSLAALREICVYVYNCLPAHCHGNREKVAQWLVPSMETT